MKANEHIGGYTLAIDMTARNLQDKVKAKGLPWSAAKGFDTFTPVAPYLPVSAIPDPHNVRLWLKVNGETRQDGVSKDMIFSVPRLIEHVSSIMTLEAGDLLLTGTPKGVGQVNPGDEITAGLELPEAPSKVLAELKYAVQQRKGGYVFSE